MPDKSDKNETNHTNLVAKDENFAPYQFYKDKISRIEDDLENEKKWRKTERFYIIAVIAIIAIGLGFYFFHPIESAMFFALIIAILIGLAQKLEQDDIAIMLQNISNKLTPKK